MGVFDMLVVVLPETALCWCAEDNMSTGLPHLVDKHLQVIDIMIPCPVARKVFFLVIVSELTYHIVAGPHHGKDFL